jgi:NAD(P) transhydrogenase subunit beta
VTAGVLEVALLGAAILFLLALGGLSQQTTARRGNTFGMAGMALALVATSLHPDAHRPVLGAIAIVGGAWVGLRLARRVEMTQMPELVAILHSLVGLAAVLVGWSTWWAPVHKAATAEATIHAVEVIADIVIGAITFTGSVVAWGKLDGRFSGKPLLLPARHAINLGLVAAIAVLGVVAVGGGWSGTSALVVATGIAGVLGAHLVLAIGGADMPVVVSLLNSYSGWTASAAGFMLGNDLLIITGALVGSSGAILSIIMCRAMNRSILNVVFGGFGAEPAPQRSEAAAGPLVEPTETTVEALAGWLTGAREVVIVPGYGMAVARAQTAVRAVADALTRGGTRVRYAIHPVAGRLPGHMNVLLAEAGVAYADVLELDDIQGDFPSTDVVLVLGANDIVNPAAEEDPASPIAGMPVLQVWKAARVIVVKRGKGSGYAGIENPLFLRDNTAMLYGDCNTVMESLRLSIG